MIHIQKKSNYEIRISNKKTRESKAISLYASDNESLESIYKKLTKLISENQK